MPSAGHSTNVMKTLRGTPVATSLGVRGAREPAGVLYGAVVPRHGPAPAFASWAPAPAGKQAHVPRAHQHTSRQTAWKSSRERLSLLASCACDFRISSTRCLLGGACRLPSGMQFR